MAWQFSLIRGLSIDITLELLPGYSPDFMPVEHLLQWLREDVTYHTCYEKEAHLIDKVEQFQHSINANANELADRLWVTTYLDTEVEKLRVSS